MFTLPHRLKRLRIRKVLVSAVRAAEPLHRSWREWPGLPRTVPPFSGNYFGCSRKQGVSLRMPLFTCNPTELCAAACYAHDVLDATPGSVVRGVVGGWIANHYERGGIRERCEILTRMNAHSKQAVRAAVKELRALPRGFERRPSIRFSHVGELPFFPRFANALARQTHDISHSNVDCAIYTRHQGALKLDPDLWIINFTLDRVSQERRAWVPESARIVYSAFDGEISPDVAIDFLEHHRHSHAKPVGRGRICPATKPETKVRTCNACRCNLRFTRPKARGASN